MAEEEKKADEKKEFEPKIVGFLCKWCSPVFFFELFSVLADPPKEKNGSKRNSGRPARKKGVL
jgi:hypothetical protein